MDSVVSTRVADGEDDRIEEYADTHGMTRSEAARALIRTGISKADQPPGTHVSYGALAALLGALLAVSQYADASGAIGPVGVGLVLLGLAHDLAHRLGAI